MGFLTGTISTETAGVSSSPLAIGAGETVITLDVVSNGTHNNSRMTLQHSPDGTNWIPTEQTTNGNGSITLTLATAQVRAYVISGEGTAQTATIFITSK